MEMKAQSGLKTVIYENGIHKCEISLQPNKFPLYFSAEYHFNKLVLVWETFFFPIATDTWLKGKDAEDQCL